MEVGSGEVPPPPVVARETFTVGGALARSFGIWTSGFPFFVVPTTVLYLPFLLYPQPKSFGLQAFGVVYLGAVLQALLNFLVTGAFTYAVVERLRGRKVDLRRTLSVGFANYGPLLSTSITTGLMVGLAALLCLVPGVILWLRWMLCIPVVVVEGMRGNAARNRSEALTVGHREGLFGMLVLLTLLSTVLGGVVGYAFGRNDSLLHRFLARVVLDSLLTTFTAVLYAVTYFQLRSEKEGLDINQLAAVFE
jgi:hypothetical protein